MSVSATKVLRASNELGEQVIHAQNQSETSLNMRLHETPNSA